MADKKEKIEKTESKDGFWKKFLDSLLGQSIARYTKPAVRKIPAPILKLLKKVGIDEIFPVFSVALSSILPKGNWLSDRASDLLAEASEELRTAINETVGDTATPSVPTEDVKEARPVNLTKLINSVVLNPELSEDRVAELLLTCASLFINEKGEERSDGEKKLICVLLGQMNPREFYIFLIQKQGARNKYLSIFIKKAAEEKEGSFEEALKDFKDELRKLAERGKIVCHEILIPGWNMVKPALDKVDGHFAATEPVGGAIVSLRQRAEAFRAEQRR